MVLLPAPPRRAAPRLTARSSQDRHGDDSLPASKAELKAAAQAQETGEQADGGDEEPVEPGAAEPEPEEQSQVGGEQPPESPPEPRSLSDEEPPPPPPPDELGASEEEAQPEAAAAEGLKEPGPKPAASEHTANGAAPAMSGESMEITMDVAGADGTKEARKFTVNKGETMGSVKRRMSVSTGLTPEQLGVLLGADAGSDYQTVGDAGVITADTRIQLPTGAGMVRYQFRFKKKFQARSTQGKFYPIHLSIARGELTFRKDGPEGKVVRSGSAVGCKVDTPKKARKGHEHAFRVDLAQKDSKKDSKYVISVSDAADLTR